MKYLIRTFDPISGATLRTEVESESEDRLRDATASTGLVLLELRPQRTWRLSGLVDRRKATRVFCIEVAALLRAGLSLSEAIGSLSVRGDGPEAALHKQIHQSLLNGQRLSDALAQCSDDFPAILVAAVRAGERTRRIAEALEDFVAYDESVEVLRRRAVSAAVYPALVVGFGLGVALFLLAYVVPRFARIYESTTASASLPTQILLAVGTAIDSHRLLFLACLATLVVGLVYGLADARIRRGAAIRLAGWRPVAGIARRYQVARMTQALAMLLRGGFPLPDALRLSGALALQPGLSAAVRRVTQDVVEGRLISGAWSAHGVGGEFDRRLLQAGERTGELGTVFDALSKAYSREVETAMERASSLIEPLLLMFVAVLIGTLVLLMYMPIFDLAGSLQR
ncbi:MAG: type II secretion system F family protein [Betaproteobacteria bacterium]